MTTRSWTDRLRHIVDGEPVSGSVASRPDRTLEGNLRYLKELVEQALLGEVLMARDVTVAENVLVGQPVSYNSTTQQFEKAFAGVSSDPDTGLLVPLPSNSVFGVVQSKTNSTLADVVVSGWVELDITNAVVGDVTAGEYYLSAAVEGHLESQRPPVSVSVLWADGAGHVLVRPQQRDFLEDHIHYRIELACRPAGDLRTAVSNLITDPDVSIRGWLPASHESFDGQAPAGAHYGYNLAAHPGLKSIFPPIPVGSYSLLWDAGNNVYGGREVSRDLCVIDQYGIWWMSDCEGEVPWPDGVYLDSSSSSLTPVSEAEPVCFDPQMTLTLYLTRMTFMTDRSVVTSLAAAEGSPITITDCDGKPAATGDLLVALNLTLAQEDVDAEGYQVIKSIVAGKFQRGPVVEGLIAGSANISLTSTDQTTDDDVTVHQGRVTIDLANTNSDREIEATVARLDNTVERFYLDNVPYIGFLAGRESSVAYRFHVPSVNLPATPAFRLRGLLFGRTAGTLPTFTVEYLLIPATLTAAAVPSVRGTLTFNSAVAVGANQYVQVTSDELEVTAGDTLVLYVGRSASDGYAGEAGIIRATGLLTTATP